MIQDPLGSSVWRNRLSAGHQRHCILSTRRHSTGCVITEDLSEKICHFNVASVASYWLVTTAQGQGIYPWEPKVSIFGFLDYFKKPFNDIYNTISSNQLKKYYTYSKAIKCLYSYVLDDCSLTEYHIQKMKIEKMEFEPTSCEPHVSCGDHCTIIVT